MKRGYTRNSGISMRLEPTRVRFERDTAPGPKQDYKLADRLVEVRKLLRTNLSIADIAASLGVSAPTLVGFIKRRRLCNLTDRRNFSSLKRSMAREEQREAQS